MTPAINEKAWSTVQARAARAGAQLLRSEGDGVVTVVFVDRRGNAQTIRSAQQLEDLLAALEIRGVAA